MRVESGRVIIMVTLPKAEVGKGCPIKGLEGHKASINDI